MALGFLKKFKDEVSKLDTVGVGIKTTEQWLTTGNYALNRALSGDFRRGIPLSKISLFAGPSGSGKSFIAGNLCYHAQKQGCHVLYLDSEHAIDVDYLAKIGVDISEENLTYMSVTTIEDVNAVLAKFFKNYIEENKKDNYDAQKVLIVLDSLAMLSSSTEMENYDKKGEIKSDQGILAKRRKAMLRLAVGHLGRLPVGMVLTDHVYPADIMLGDGAWTITNSTKFSSSIIGIVTKLKLKEEGEVTGVRMRFETYKSRFAKLGSKVELEVPYNKGMSPFSGLVEQLEEMKVIRPSTVPGKKQGWMVADIGDETFFFKPAEMTHADVDKLLSHPACAPILSRSGPETVSLEELDQIDDHEDTVLELPRGVKSPKASTA